MLCKDCSESLLFGEAQITFYTCEKCGRVQGYITTRGVPKYCPKCSDKYKLCQKCGKKMK